MTLNTFKHRKGNALCYNVKTAMSLGNGNFFSSLIISWDHCHTCGLYINQYVVIRPRLYFKLSLDYLHLIQCKCYVNSCCTVLFGNNDQKNLYMFSTEITILFFLIFSICGKWNPQRQNPQIQRAKSVLNK